MRVASSGKAVQNNIRVGVYIVQCVAYHHAGTEVFPCAYPYTDNFSIRSQYRYVKFMMVCNPPIIGMVYGIVTGIVGRVVIIVIFLAQTVIVS